jgi:phosphotriesterase-related protein
MSDAQTTINTVTGTITPDELGRTLAHEHLLVGWPGWESDTFRQGPGKEECLARCRDRVAEMTDHGVRSMIDPCPNDLGRDVEFMATVAAKTGLQIVCATGLYKEDQGGSAYWKFRGQFGDGVESIAEMYVRELTQGIGETGIKAGIIKVATGAPAVTEYERMLLEAAATASLETGAPITTHTDEGVLGDEQQRILVEHGVPAHKIIIGHSCGSPDHDYHRSIVGGGSYIGFDRFGILVIQPDEVRVQSLLALLAAGYESQIVVAHDSVWCWRGEPIPDPEAVAELLDIWTPSHFFERIIPQLKDGGATDAQIDRMLEENPRRFFAGEPVPAPVVS